MKRLLLSSALILFVLSFGSAQTDKLRENFHHPPESARPWVYWVWMDGNITREGITADLESMKEAGIGGVIIMEVNVGIPRGPINFMSSEWRALFKHVVNETERLGLQVTLMSGPGWTGSGGPWVKPEQSMMHLVASDTVLTGPKRFDGFLRQPTRWPAFFGDGLLPPELEKTKNEFYRDVTVLAFPTPAGSERISNIDEKALYVRAPYSSQPGVQPSLPAPATYPTIPPNAVIAAKQVVDVTSSMTAGGNLVWNVPAGSWTIMRFGNTSTGATTRPAPVPGVGLESDKLDTTALNAHFDAFIGSLLRDLGPRNSGSEAGWKWLHMDSWEMGAQNWTPAFREEFKRLRGYDLYPYLPAIAGRVVGSGEISERFLWDLRQTAQDLLLKNHALHLKELGRRSGFGLSIEPYDMTPCADMTLGGIADVPMCEFWMYGFNTSFSVLEATSIAHTNGKAVVAAESFTSSDEERWLAYPTTMKTLGDWAFAAGVNRFVFHRSQHQPWLNRLPGMTMGPYGVHWERTQTWWNMAPAYHTYLSRCQYLLRQGLPVADVCFLVPEGSPQVFRPPTSAVRGSPPDRLGYNFDGCAPEVVLSKMSVKDGRLVLPDGMSYRILVLPERETMTPALLRKIKELVEAGATVVGPRVLKSPGLSGYPDCDTEVKRLADELWGNSDGIRITEHRLGKGRVVWKHSSATRIPPSAVQTTASGPEQYGDFGIVASLLISMSIAPDFESDAALRYTHRRLKETDLYFIANPSSRAVSAQCAFRVAGKRPQLWDAVTGEIRELPKYTSRNGRTSITLQFEAAQSCFVFFEAPLGEKRSNAHNDPNILVAGTLEGSWDVFFNPDLGGPKSIKFESLGDWTMRPEDGVKYFSGTATYRKVFDLPVSFGGVEKKSTRLWLNLGTVFNMARVRLNGRELGIVWCAPWRVEMTDAVQKSGNKLEIEVANLWPNRLIGDEFQPPDTEYGKDGNLLRWPDWLLKNEQRPSKGRYTFATWRHFTKDSPLLPSGLLGPVRIFKSAE
ncbi:MAG: glycosyl hydrolase [Ignavibacteriales bacterium]|nr:glycosyl hydrolase [Ignavibacteriales bacterium]